MEQQASSLVAVMLLRHARRALLLLGGVFVWWLVVLAGGAAHADDTGDTVAPQRADGVVGVVDQASRTLTSSLRTSPSHVTRSAAAVSGQAPEPVASTVGTLTTVVEPSLSLTTTRAADVLDHTVSQAETALGPVLVPILHQQTSSRSATTKQTRAHLRASAAHPAQGPAAAVVSDQTVSPTPADAVARLGSQDGASLPAGPGAPGAPALPGGSSAGGGAGMASLAGLFLMLPGVNRPRRARDAAGLPSAPAFPPGSSPD
jgi:hypothetical protein